MTGGLVGSCSSLDRARSLSRQAMRDSRIGGKEEPSGKHVRCCGPAEAEGGTVRLLFGQADVHVRYYRTP